MVVDTSAYLAILLAEPDERGVVEALTAARAKAMSAGNYLECAMVATGRDAASRTDLDRWLATHQIEIVAVDARQARMAADAFERFGKGRHPAGLNYGDCFAYALAKSLGAPLLFKGRDFAQTDVTPALSPG